MAIKQYETVKVEKNGDGITWVILNRPEKRNAMSPQLHADMEECLFDLSTDAETKVLVLTGAGEAYCAGQDLKLYFREGAKDPKLRFKASEDSNSWRWQRLSTFPKPTISMVNGFCFGGAFTHVCACDFAIAAHEATFGLSEVNWGIIPGGLVSWNVVDVLGFRDAMYYAVTCDTFDGKKAEEIRFVNKSVPLKDLKKETIALAKKLMEKSPEAVRYTKEAIRAVKRMSAADAYDYLKAKSDALKANDKSNGREQGMKQFLDDKTYRPGLEPFKKVG
jgi:trans-feruloyl-CoA hydratase/vanillin synthase